MAIDEDNIEAEMTAGAIGTNDEVENGPAGGALPQWSNAGFGLLDDSEFSMTGTIADPTLRSEFSAIANCGTPPVGRVSR